MPRKTRLAIAVFVLCLFSVSPATGAMLRGSVRDENGAPVGDATVTVRAASGVGGPWQSRTDVTGAFAVTLPGPGDYLLDVEKQAYYEIQQRTVHVEGVLEVSLVLSLVREVFQSLDVSAQPSPVDVAETGMQQRLSGTELNDIPYPNSHSFRNSLKLMPGVVQDNAGGIHFNGSSENQVEYVLNGFDLTDPVTGTFRSTLPVEGIRSVDYASGRYSPEYGNGSAGVLGIRTETGTDAFRYTATDFIPGVDIQQGLRLGNWYPRVGFSGPILRGRAWFSDTLGFEYNTALVTGLPSGQNTRSAWAANDVLHAQVNLNPRNILYTDFLVNQGNQDRAGLGVLDPVATTQTVRSQEYFGSLKDQVYVAGRYLLEIGYAHNEFFNRQAPQGTSPYIYSPEGRSGNYFLAGTQNSARDQMTLHGYAPEFRAAGSHQVELGADGDLLRYDGDFRRTSYELIGLAGEVLYATSFTGSGLFGVRDRTADIWARDQWRISKRLQIDAGIRWDWDALVGNYGWSPRLAFSWSPFAAGHTRVAGGYAVAFDQVPLDPFGRMLDQSAVTVVPGQTAVTTAFAPAPSGLKLPRAGSWTLSADHEVTSHVTASANYLRRRGTELFSFLNNLDPNAPPSLLPFPNGAAPGLYQLTNLRRDDFDSVEVRVRQTLSGQYEWMASYTRSRAVSNAVLDMNTLTPLQVLASAAPMPWDTPNRFLGWAYLPLPWKNWSVATMADASTGFPFSVQQPNGAISGAVNSYRYPFHFDLNLAIERIVTLRGYRFALRGGVNNLMDSRNPTAVNNIIGSPQYLQFLGYEGRHFVVRIRFFGRSGLK